MGLLSFLGGIHPPHEKELTEKKAIEVAKEPKVVYLSLRQHIGAPSDVAVSIGDTVKVGQIIGKASGFISANVHSSVSGTVKAIKEQETIGGMDVCVVIESDGLGDIHESVKPRGTLDSLSKEELLLMVKEAGIVGMGGAGFPTHIKLSPPKEKPISAIVLNGAECEPYLTADHRLMLEEPEKIILGLKVMMKILGVTEAFIGIEDNKLDAIETLSKIAATETGINVVGLHTKYPQGAEKQLIYACTKRNVPSGGLPMDVGVMVNNVATAAAIATTLQTGMPLIDRVCTVTGSAVSQPKNLRVKVGTMVSEIVDQCGGTKQVLGKAIMGGPMMGLAVPHLDLPATKTSSGILLMTESEAKTPEASNCIKCMKCVTICPAFLQPLYLSAHALKYDYSGAEKYHAMDCIECGSCSFICPAKRPLLPSIRIAKREILARKRQQG